MNGKAAVPIQSLSGPQRRLVLALIEAERQAKGQKAARLEDGRATVEPSAA